MAFSISQATERISEIVQAVLQLIEGRGNFIGRVTLTAGATTTVVSFQNCSKDCEVFLSPRTANAAAALGTTYISSIVQGGFTITHANAATLDRTFAYECVGG